MTSTNRTLIWSLGAALLIATFYYFAEQHTVVHPAGLGIFHAGPAADDLFSEKGSDRAFPGRTDDSGPADDCYLLWHTCRFAVFVRADHRGTGAQPFHGRLPGTGRKTQNPVCQPGCTNAPTGLPSTDQSLATKTQEMLSTWFRPALVGSFVGGFVGVAGNILVTFISVTFIMFFFLQENHLFLNILNSFVPNEQEPKVRHAVQESSSVLTSYFGGLLNQLVVFSVIVAALLWILGIDNALLIGHSGRFNIVPYVAPIRETTCVFITLSSHLDAEFAVLMPMLLKVLVAFGITQTIDNNFTGPMILSKSVQAHPLEIFIVTRWPRNSAVLIGMVIGFGFIRCCG